MLSGFSEALIRETIEAWQPLYPSTLTEADALEILRSVNQLLDLIGE